MSNIWKTLALGGAAFFAGFVLSGSFERKARTADVVALQRSMLDYSAASVAAQKAEAERILRAVTAARPAPLPDITEELARAPSSRVCVDSPAVGLVLDRLRNAPTTSGSIQP